MKIVLIHFYLQHLKLDCLFLGNACKISSGFFQLRNFPKVQNYVLHRHPKFRYHMIILGKSLLQIFCQPRPQGFFWGKSPGDEDNILQAREGFNLLKFVCFRKLNKAWRACLLNILVKALKLPFDEIRVPKYVYSCTSFRGPVLKTIMQRHLFFPIQSSKNCLLNIYILVGSLQFPFASFLLYVPSLTAWSGVTLYAE